jgi:hypothetical protein
VAVVSFDGTDDFIDFNLPSTVDVNGGAYTDVFVIERNTDTTWDTIVCHVTSAPNRSYAISIAPTDQVSVEALVSGSFTGGDSSENGSPGGGTTFTVTSADSWCIVAITKTAGTSRARLHKFTPGGGWVRTNTSVQWANQDAAGASAVLTFGRYRNATVYTDFGALKIAAWARWRGTELADADIDGLDGGNATAWNSVGGGYTELVEFTANSGLAGLKGLVTESARTGATTVAGDDPPSTVYTLGGGSTSPTVNAVAASASASAPATVQAISDSITAVPASATASAPAPGVSSGTNVTITVPAAASATASSPELGASQTLSPDAAAASASAPAPALAATSNVAAVPATAAASASSPSLSTGANSTVSAPAATATATAPANTVSGTAVIAAAAATANAGAGTHAVVAIQNVNVAAVTALANAPAQTPGAGSAPTVISPVEAGVVTISGLVEV